MSDSPARSVVRFPLHQGSGSSTILCHECRYPSHRRHPRPRADHRRRRDRDERRIVHGGSCRLEPRPDQALPPGAHHAARGFTTDSAVADRYYALANAGFDYARLWATKRATISRPRAAKALWVEGNPYYERVEGVVAGTPSLAVYDVILDAGSSAEEDPASAVPFDLKLADGQVLREAGQPLQPDRGHALGHAPRVHAPSRPISTGRKSRVRRGAARRRRVSRPPPPHSPSTPGSSTAPRGRGSPTRSDAFTAVVVMVPTMSEYFGQWKVSRFVLGDQGEGRRVQRRLEALRHRRHPRWAPRHLRRDPAGDRQGRRRPGGADEARAGRALVVRREAPGAGAERQAIHARSRPTSSVATAQERATAIAGQVTQAAARLKVKIVQ